MVSFGYNIVSGCGRMLSWVPNDRNLSSSHLSGKSMLTGWPEVSASSNHHHSTDNIPKCHECHFYGKITNVLALSFSKDCES